MARLIDSGPGCPTPTPLRGRSAAEARGLVYDDAVKAETDALYPLVADFVTPTGGLFQKTGQSCPVENVVAENQ